MIVIQSGESKKYKVGQKLPKQAIVDRRFTIVLKVEYLPIEVVDAKYQIRSLFGRQNNNCLQDKEKIPCLIGGITSNVVTSPVVTECILFYILCETVHQHNNVLLLPWPIELQRHEGFNM